MRDVIREKQRAVLVDYLIARSPELDQQDANRLYSHFLIDVEMAPCMMTSRIKQAIGSVQLFVQRCLMNLEDWHSRGQFRSRRIVGLVEVDEESPSVGGEPQSISLSGKLD